MKVHHAPTFCKSTPELYSEDPRCLGIARHTDHTSVAVDLIGAKPESSCLVNERGKTGTGRIVNTAVAALRGDFDIGAAKIVQHVPEALGKGLMLLSGRDRREIASLPLARLLGRMSDASFQCSSPIRILDRLPHSEYVSGHLQF